MKARQLLPAILFSAVSLAGCGGDDDADGDGSDSSSGETLHVIEHATTNTVQHIGPPGEKDSLGDILAYANPIFDAANEKRIGSDNGWCVRTVVGDAYECAWTTTLDDGQIIVEGPFYDDRDSTVAITGGTGAYEGASGEMDLHYRDPEGKEYDFIFHLE